VYKRLFISIMQQRYKGDHSTSSSSPPPHGDVKYVSRYIPTPPYTP
jgi:hypothetical protein